MSNNPVIVAPPPPGYVSAEAKTTYIVVVLVLAALAVLLTFILPFAVMIPLQMSMMADTGYSRVIHADDAVLWQGKVWMVREPMPQSYPGTRIVGTGSGRAAGTLISWDPATGASKAEADRLPMVHARPLADGDRLWLISLDRVLEYKAGQPPPAPRPAYLTDPTRPFLYEGRPAVIDFLPEGPMLRTLEEDGWTDVGLVDLKPPEGQAAAPDSDLVQAGVALNPPEGQKATAADVRVLPRAAGFAVLARFGGALYYREGLGLPKERVQPWQKVTETAGAWTATYFGGQPRVFYYHDPSATPPPSYASHDVRLVGLQPGESGWLEFYSRQGNSQAEGLSTMGPQPYSPYSTFSMGICPTSETDFVTVVDGGFMGTEVITVVGDKVTQHRLNPMVSLESHMFLLMILAYGTPAAIPLLLAIVLSVLVAVYRTRLIEVGETTALLAPLWRRGVAALLDFLIAVAPAAAVYYSFVVTMTDFGGMAAEPQNVGPKFLHMMYLTGAAAAWMLVVAVVFSFTEGRWGGTPGKWLLGIRVRGLDLRPCGFGRALLRNLLRIVDVIFTYLVGLVVASLTERFQRVGDLAAKTVVISARAWPPQ